MTASECQPSSSNPLESTNLPAGVQTSMWAKVQKYCEDKSLYTKAPGVSDYSCVLVKSISSVRPHFVQRTGSGKYKCDKECLMFKSTNGICSHCLLVSSINGEVDTLLGVILRREIPSFTRNLVNMGYLQAVRRKAQNEKLHLRTRPPRSGRSLLMLSWKSEQNEDSLLQHIK